MKYLVIVESPSKEKTIEKYLGEDYKVTSSKGHFRDLATSGKDGLGVDVDNDFAPKYVVKRDKSSVVKEISKLVKKVDRVILATDPDREGEAISWHLKEVLELSENDYERVVFNEITKDVILKQMKCGRKIDDDLVRSQETRRILDRIIGFRLSKLMQKKTEGSSAGRVQSVALKLIVDKEEEIKAFVIETYYEIDAIFSDMEAKLISYNDENIKLTTEEECQKILAKLNKEFIVKDVVKKKTKKMSKPPFTTSTMQQEAATKLNFSAKKTMSVAQKMYEGIELENETVGLITYMRTDSIRLSDEFIKSTYKYIETTFGHEYVGFVKKSKKNDNVQDAHEAIRPTSISRHPDKVKKFLTADEYKLYSLIYARALASLMKESVSDATTINLDNNNYLFRATGQVIIFDGYLKVYKDYEARDEQLLPNVKVLDKLVSHSINYTKHHTNPPARYSESKLIKELEELGIGRPSTYAKIIDTLKVRRYVDVVEKRFIPTKIGCDITLKLQENFSEVINVKYTAKMEEQLDQIASGDYNYLKLLKSFYNTFEPLVQHALTNMQKVEAEKTGEICPNCGLDLIYRHGKYGKFVGCSGYPNCNYIKPMENTIIMPCPNCQEGHIIERKSKRGKIFYGCDNYPACKTAFWDKPLDEHCPKCNALMTINRYKQKKCSVCDTKTTTKKKTAKKTSAKKVAPKKTTKKTSKKEAK